MSTFKRGRIYWYKFVFDTEEIRESTRQTNDKTARNMEAAHRARLAKERDERRSALGRLQCDAVARCPECEKLFNAAHPVIDAAKSYCSDQCATSARRKKISVPTLQEFAENRIEPWAKATFAKGSPKTWLWYRQSVRSISASGDLGGLALNHITHEAVSRYASAKLAEDYAVASVNSVIRAVRRFLNLAKEWGVVDAVPALKLLSGENHREHVVSLEEEQKYLDAADPTLQAFAVLLFDTGMRPDEAYRLRWEGVSWRNGEHGSVRITQGKSKAAKRTLFMSMRVRFNIEHRWEEAGRPNEGWVWPAETQSGHFGESTLKKRHAKAIESANAKKIHVRPFITYAIRHTFLTRLGESGCDAWTLARIAGHSNIAMSQRYVHASDDSAANAMAKLSGYNSRHSVQKAKRAQPASLPVNTSVLNKIYGADERS